MLTDQFQRMRDGDRYWYKLRLSPRYAYYAEHQTLAKIIRRNTTIGSEIPNDVFRQPAP